MDQRKPARRSPSILVTDARNAPLPAPFAKKSNNKFSGISVSNILSNGSEAPSSARRQTALSNARLRGARSGGSAASTGSSNAISRSGVQGPYLRVGNTRNLSYGTYNGEHIGTRIGRNGRNGRNDVAGTAGGSGRKSLNMPIQPLPARTSKTSQKLVYIPDDAEDEHDKDEKKVRFVAKHSSLADKKQLKEAKERIEKMKKKKEELPRVTAYYVSDSIVLEQASEFLKKTHKVSPRLYDEVLYVPYQLPLLDGSNGFRVRSNDYVVNSVGKSKVEEFLDKSEQQDYHFEYYSGQEVISEEERDKLESPERAEHSEHKDVGKSTAVDPIDVEESSGSGSKSDDENNYASDFKNNEEDAFDPAEPQYFNYNDDDESNATNSITNHADMFVFNYGVIVFWNFTKNQEENILADLSFADEDDFFVQPIDEQYIETEEFCFEFDKDTTVPRIFNDIITLKSNDHLIKMTLSHAIAQSTKLCRFESRMSEVLYSVSKLPKILALTGRLGLSREQLMKKSGKLFHLRVDVNLSSNILDVPEFFWSFEPSLNPLYTAARDYLEIDERVEVINDRCKMFLEFTDIISETIAENNMNKITWIIIIIIIISLCVSGLEIFVRYSIISKH